MNLLTYNLFQGAQKTYSDLVDFMLAQKPDIVCLQEVNGWQDNDFARCKDFVQKTGLAYFVFGESNTRHKLATFARFPIESSQVYTKNFWHCAIKTGFSKNNKSFTIFNLHLCPKNEDTRLNELKQILAAMDATAPTLLAGDFNSLSRHDNYSSTLRADLQRNGITKFGTDSVEYRVTDALEKAGIIDVCAEQKNMSPTVPTPFNSDTMHRVPVRLDYVFATQPFPVGAVQVLKSPATKRISNHYPLRVEFEF